MSLVCKQWHVVIMNLREQSNAINVSCFQVVFQEIPEDLACQIFWIESLEKRLENMCLSIRYVALQNSLIQVSSTS